MNPDEAFKNIGILMSAFAARLPIRSAEHNAKIQEKLNAYARTSTWDLSRDQIKDRDNLQRSFASPCNVSALKKAVPGIDAVLKGSPRMDTGAAFMLLGTYADFSRDEDNATSFELMKLVVLARPDWDPDAPVKKQKTKSKPKI